MAVRRSPKPLVGVRFPPPEPTLFYRSYMLNLLSRWLPVAIVLMIVFNLIASYGADNAAAVSANVIALTGWLYVVANEFTGKKNVEISN